VSSSPVTVSPSMMSSPSSSTSPDANGRRSAMRSTIMHQPGLRYAPYANRKRSTSPPGPGTGDVSILKDS
jgi:hypothetical protein